MTASSFLLPPGWITAVAPARPTTSRPSGKGKKASEAATVPDAASPARATASSAASTRDICPAPTPTAMPSRTSTTAFDFT